MSATVDEKRDDDFGCGMSTVEWKVKISAKGKVKTLRT